MKIKMKKEMRQPETVDLYQVNLYMDILNRY